MTYWNKDRTDKKCKRHGNLTQENIGIKIYKKEPLHVLLICLICKKELKHKQIRENNRYLDNLKKSSITCSVCKNQINPNQFNKSELSKLTAFRCKPCVSLCNSDFNKKKSQIEFRKYRLKIKYNITLDEYNKLMIIQNNLCKICHQPESKKRPKDNLPYDLSVDHCHKTGIIRGLLCKKCNLVLGNANDSSDILRKAAKYLDGFNENS